MFRALFQPIISRTSSFMLNHSSHTHSGRLIFVDTTRRINWTLSIIISVSLASEKLFHLQLSSPLAHTHTLLLNTHKTVSSKLGWVSLWLSVEMGQVELVVFFSFQPRPSGNENKMRNRRQRRWNWMIENTDNIDTQPATTWKALKRGFMSQIFYLSFLASSFFRRFFTLNSYTFIHLA